MNSYESKIYYNSVLSMYHIRTLRVVWSVALQHFLMSFMEATVSLALHFAGRRTQFWLAFAAVNPWDFHADDGQLLPEPSI